MEKVQPYMLWNQAVDLTGCGKKAKASDASKALTRLRKKYGKAFDSAFRLRMMTERVETLEQLLTEWSYE
jgi:predicted outer membrane protein